MNIIDLSQFPEVWCVDFEFNALPGERPKPVCLVAHDLRSDKRIRMFKDELRSLKAPPLCHRQGQLVYRLLRQCGTNLSPSVRVAVTGKRARPLCGIQKPH